MLSSEARTSLFAQAADRTQVIEVLDNWAETFDHKISPQPPLCQEYRSSSVCGSPSPAHGNMVIAETLGILHHLDAADIDIEPSAGPTLVNGRAFSTLIQAEAQAFADGNSYMGDPETTPELSSAYLEQIIHNDSTLQRLADQIHNQPDRKAPQPTPLVDLNERNPDYREFEEDGTSQITVRDSVGSIAAMSTTLGHHFGSGLVASGFFLNDTLRNFSAGASPVEPNYLRPSAHPKTMMSPVLVQHHDSEGIDAVVSPGGNHIPSYVLKSIIALEDWHLSPREAIAIPNFGAYGKQRIYLESANRWGDRFGLKPERLEKEFERAKNSLKDQGFDVLIGSAESGLGVLRSTPHSAVIGADPRRHGLALCGPS